MGRQNLAPIVQARCISIIPHILRNACAGFFLVENTLVGVDTLAGGRALPFLGECESGWPLRTLH